MSLDGPRAHLALSPDDIEPWGPGVAKIAGANLWDGVRAPARGRLVLVSAITPTPAGEGKTTTAIGLAQGLARRGHATAVALREPSIAPVLGVKGGGTGAGRAAVHPRARLDLHLTGDLHAVTHAHNTLAALVDDAVHRRRLPLDPARVVWGRVVDVGDRSLRRVITGLGDPGDGPLRETGFTLTAASEVMAILALARDPADLKARLRRMIVGFGRDGAMVTAGDVPGIDAVAALLADALRPNLVRTTEGVAALVHTGPFANVAHGCSSVIGTRFALARADWVVTEAGFAFDLGGEKFLHLKAPAAGVWPDALVIVATVRALAHHGDGDPVRGLANLDAHVAGAHAFGLDPVIALNVFDDDDPVALRAIEDALSDRGLRSARSTAVRDGSAGAEALAQAVEAAARPGTPTPLVPPGTPVDARLRVLAARLYGADGVDFSASAEADLRRLARHGLHTLPVCVAKTPASLSDDPTRPGRPTGHRLTVHGLLPMPGAGHVVARCGPVRLMPGLPAQARASDLGLSDDGTVTGLDG